MASINTKTKVPAPRTHQGGLAARESLVNQLRRSVMCCLLWENSFYEDGVSIADRIKNLVHAVSLEEASAIAIEARNKMYLRHVPLLIVREMARHPNLKSNPSIVSNTLATVVQRADELTEFVAIYWKDGRSPLSKQVKLGLAKAFNKFDEYQLAKYNRDKDVRLRDVMFLAHPRPFDAGDGKFTRAERKAKLERELSPREGVFHRLANDELATPDTWEVELSKGADKAATFRRLMRENNLGGLAFLRNLRGMTEAGITKSELKAYGDANQFNKVLPFRFIAAARVAPTLEDIIEPWMLKCLTNETKLAGRTLLLVDVSGSMGWTISKKSDLTRLDAANGLAILCREICDEPTIMTFSERTVAVPTRRGFALRDAVTNSQTHSGTYLGKALIEARASFYDRLIVITDEQAADSVFDKAVPDKSYIINVASDQNGVLLNKKWKRINGWSESVIDFIQTLEASND